MTTPKPKPTSRLDVAIVGGGFGGLYAIYKLRGMGLNVRAYEAGSGIGGTWFWNQYPGARCDLESLDYSYGFSDELQQEWEWSERYGGQAEILRYINHVADRFDLRRDVQLNTRISSAHFLEGENEWALRSTDGEEIRARYFVVAAGSLSAPRVPDIDGLENFKGEWFHPGRWPQEGVDFTGKRVGIIGTGSSGIQMVPLIAAQASELTVFQRTANYCLPARNAAMDKAYAKERKRNYRANREAARRTTAGIVVEKSDLNALDVSTEVRQATYEAHWKRGGSIAFLASFKDLLTDKAANETAAEFVRNKIRRIVKDPAKAAILVPTDHPIGAKRLCLDTNYFDTFNQAHVSVVDVRKDPIQEITATGVRTASSAFELDAIVFATGYDAMTGALSEIDVRGAGGRTLKDHWSAGPLTYLGLMVSGFPNMFLVAGPGSPAVKVQFVAAIEHGVEWIADTLSHLNERGFVRIEAEAAAEGHWVSHVNEVANGTLFPQANSWYLGANIPGKPRVFMPYVGGFEQYIRLCDEAVKKGYQGFALSPAESPAPALQAR